MVAPLRVHALIDNLGAGGAELLLAEFAKVAHTAHIELSVGSLRGNGPMPAAERLRKLGIEPSLAPVETLWRPADVGRVRRHLERVQPDVVHTHLGYADLLGAMAARPLGIPVVSTLHADWWGGPLRDRVRFRLMALARRRAALLIAVSDSARRAYLARGWDRPERVVVVRNGISTEPRPGSGRAVREELGLTPAHTVAVMLSRVEREKGHEVAVAAVAALTRRFPGLRLVIVGDGPRQADVTDLARPVGEAVIMTGHREDVMEVLDAADLLLQPSFADAFPTSLLEAMAAGTPIVATAVGGIPEIVDSGSALLVRPPPTSESIAAALAQAIEDPRRREARAAAARLKFDREFRAESWAHRTREVYDRAMAAETAVGGLR